MATTDLKLDAPGSLPKPGPVGRIVRLGFGVSCAWYVAGLLQVGGDLLTGDGHIRSLVWNGILPGLFLVSYVVNIGYSRAWGKWPAVVSAAVLALIAVAGYFTAGTVETATFARSIWVWELYVFGHLSISFILAAIISTPGCEMRAIHDAYSRITGTPTNEHYCPVGPLNPIDQWEARGRD